MNTNELLAERKSTHGEYRDDARAAMRLKDNLADEINRRVVRGQPILSDIQRHALDMILHKVARIVTGDAYFKDHWDDIAGYAKLVSDRIEKEEPPPPEYALKECHCASGECIGSPKYVTCRNDNVGSIDSRTGRPGRRVDVV